MAQKLKFGNGTWATKKGSTLAYNDENNNYKPLPFTTTRDSIATRVNKEGLIEVVGNDIPRIDYTDSADGVLLLEPQRTNYVLYSETEGIIRGSNGWSGDSDSTITQNYGTTPFTGSELKSTRIQFTSSSKEFRNNFSSVTITPTSSIWIKGLVGKTIKFGSNGNEGVFTLNGEWQKLVQTGSSLSTNRLTINTYSSTTARDIEIYAPQLEQGSYATSYIPTYGSTVTRQAETCNGSGNSEVFNDSEGVLFADISTFSETGSAGLISLSDGTNNNRVTIELDGNIVKGRITPSVGVLNASTNITISTKVVLKYKENDFALWVNGFEAAVSNSGNTFSNGTLTELAFDRGDGAEDFYGKTKEIGYYDTILTDLELETLTSYRSLSELVTELNLNTL